MILEKRTKNARNDKFKISNCTCRNNYTRIAQTFTFPTALFHFRTIEQPRTAKLVNCHFTRLAQTRDGNNFQKFRLPLKSELLLQT